MTVINTNIKALFAENSLKSIQRDSLKATMELSTGKRINSSADDPAGMAIASRMTQNIKSLGQAIANTGNAISLIQTADGSAASITTMLQRMNELALQASTGSISSDQRGYLNQEFQQLKLEIDRTAATQEWNGFPIMNGKAGVPVGMPTSTTTARAVALPGSSVTALTSGDLTLLNSSGVAFVVPTSLAGDDTLSSQVANSSKKAASAIAIAAAINTQTANTGVTATANAAVIEGAKTHVGSTTIQTDLYVNGQKVSLNLASGQTEAERRQYVMDSINASSTLHGTTATESGSGGIQLSTADGRNLSVWYDSSVATAADFGLGLDTSAPSDAPGVTGVGSAAIASASSVAASTVYGTVTMKSETTYSAQPGTATGNYANFTSLGFSAGPVMKEDIGRFSFQVGADSSQTVTLDLGDFGKGGKITGAITSDSAATAIDTVAGAQNVMNLMNTALNAVAAQRSNMGSLINRLQEISDNLTTVQTNETASRSLIEDADYALASTAMSKAQIMTQAATAVLAQANTDMQTVLKLLQ